MTGTFKFGGTRRSISAEPMDELHTVKSSGMLEPEGNTSAELALVRPTGDRVDRVINTRLTKTTMSIAHLPAEILDYIVDFLHDSEHTLTSCCLVSKSWIPRTRRHLFADIVFSTDGHIQSWKKTFPDPSTSPAHYVKTLSAAPVEIVDMGMYAGGWIRAFSRVVYLGLGSPTNAGMWLSPSLTLHKSTFFPFHGLSPVLRSLRIASATLLSP